MQTKLPPLLLTHAPLVALVGNRVHWGNTPQGQPLPNVVLYGINRNVDFTYQGASGYYVNNVQFDCQGHDAAEAMDVGDAVDAFLTGLKIDFDGFRFFLFRPNIRTGPRFDKDGPKKWYTDKLGYDIHWAPA